MDNICILCWGVGFDREYMATMWQPDILELEKNLFAGLKVIWSTSAHMEGLAKSRHRFPCSICDLINRTLDHFERYSHDTRFLHILCGFDLPPSSNPTNQSGATFTAKIRLAQVQENIYQSLYSVEAALWSPSKRRE